MEDKKTKSLKRKNESEQRFIKDIVEETKNDFIKRRNNRKSFERQWELNMNFLVGNQYCDIGVNGELAEEYEDYYWQKRRVFNHIAPLIESRLSKLARINPTIKVKPKSDDDDDVSKAYVAEKLIEGAFSVSNIDKVVKEANSWSETCGTSFYKIIWNNNGGNFLGQVEGKNVFEGDTEIISISPFEIFPDNIYTEKIEDLQSIIHAKAVSVDMVKEKYGVSLMGEEIDVFGLEPNKKLNGKDNKVMENAVIVIEKYEKPSSEFPKGRLISVAGDKLLYYGDLPYKNGTNKERAFPFVKQVANKIPGCFFGSSIIERLIPVQRAFNAVKNRKHEFMNRLSAGILTVEDGSVDVDNIAEEGLNPGKVLVYRQGSKAPEIMEEGAIPPDFNDEENKLMQEFVTISGVSDVSSSSTNAHLSSASALELLIEQDNQRLVMVAEDIRNNYIEISKQVLRLYAQFIVGIKAIKYNDAFNKTKVCYADSKSADSDDVYIDNENELTFTPKQRKEMILKLYESGLLFDDDKKIRATTKEKVLAMLGYQDLDYLKGLNRLQEEKAQNENLKIRNNGLPIEEIDDDNIHIDEHTRYVLSEYDELSAKEKTRLFSHIKAHKERLNGTFINKQGEN